jgi:hypothetical protein
MAQISVIQTAKLIGLLHSADGSGEAYVRVVSANRLAVGKDPMSPTVSIDLSKEAIGPYNEAKPNGVESEVTATKTPPTKMPRRSGEYWLEVNGKRSEAVSLRDLLGQGLREIEAVRPGTLEKLSTIKPKSKRIVARDKGLLFEAELLCREYGERLIDGWWYGTNNSTQETAAWLERACNCAGLVWGKDVRTSLPR